MGASRTPVVPRRHCVKRCLVQGSSRQEGRGACPQHVPFPSRSLDHSHSSQDEPPREVRGEGNAQHPPTIITQPKLPESRGTATSLGQWRWQSAGHGAPLPPPESGRHRGSPQQVPGVLRPTQHEDKDRPSRSDSSYSRQSSRRCGEHRPPSRGGVPSPDQAGGTPQNSPVWSPRWPRGRSRRCRT